MIQNYSPILVPKIMFLYAFYLDSIFHVSQSQAYLCLDSLKGIVALLESTRITFGDSSSCKSHFLGLGLGPKNTLSLQEYIIYTPLINFILKVSSNNFYVSFSITTRELKLLKMHFPLKLKELKT